MINKFTRAEAACRRFKFEALKGIGIFWVIRKLGMEIKQPYRKMYDRVQNQ